jgi:hypothetical protein
MLHRALAYLFFVSLAAMQTVSLASWDDGDDDE